MPHSPTRVIHLRVDAPALPRAGAPCNGCGVCCAVEPCPLGIWVSGRRRGRCRALRWQPEPGLYRCAVLSQPHAVWPGLPASVARGLSRLARRWIAAGTRCDAHFERT